MPPKGGKKEEKNEMDIVKGDILARDLKIECLLDKIVRLEERAHLLEYLIDECRTESSQRDHGLEENISGLTSDAKAYDQRSQDIEEAIEKLKRERAEAYESLLNEVNMLKANHKATFDVLQAELDEAQAKIFAVREFSARRASIEKEISELKLNLEREKREHQEALNDVERVALQERERLRKEMAARIEETRVQMVQYMEDQLHSRTKKTIVENERMAKEVAYHIRQTNLLTMKNELLEQENTELHSRMMVAKEIEDDVARKNRSYQKAARILLFKLQEQHLSTNLEVNEQLEELKKLIRHNEKLSSDIKGQLHDLESTKAIIEERTKAADSTGAIEEAVKFLYACLEDLESADVVYEGNMVSERDGCEMVDTVPSARLDQLSLEQRQDFLRHLLRTAISLRSVMKNSLTAHHMKEVGTTFGTYSDVLYDGKEGEARVSVEDMFAYELDVADASKCQSSITPNRRVSCGVQADPMESNVSLHLDVKQRQDQLQPTKHEGQELSKKIPQQIKIVNIQL